MDESAAQFSSAVGDRMRAFRMSLRLSQEAFADALGGTKRGVQQNEGGKSAPNSKILLGMAEMGLNVNWLLTGRGPMLLVDLDQVVSEAVAPLEGERLGAVIEAVDRVAKERHLILPSNKRGKLVAWVYQHTPANSGRNEDVAYVGQLLNLMSDH